MVLYEVFSHSIVARYRTSLFSKASLVQIICIVLTFLSPFLVAYFTGGFWIKQKAFTEQPIISFQYRFIALLEGINGAYLSSSYENINQIYSNEFRPSVRTILEIDENEDGYNDELNFEIYISGIASTESIQSVKLLLLFNNSLAIYQNSRFESIGYLETYTTKKSSQLALSGELEFWQSNIFQDKTIDNQYNYLALNQSNLDLELLNIPNIVEQYNSRLYGTKLRHDFVSWSNPLAEGFRIEAKIRYQPFKLVYVPAFWEQFKYGWIQYISVLIPFLFVFRLVKIFIFENQLVPTIVSNPYFKMKSS